MKNAKVVGAAAILALGSVAAIDNVLSASRGNAADGGFNYGGAPVDLDASVFCDVVKSQAGDGYEKIKCPADIPSS